MPQVGELIDGMFRLERQLGEGAAGYVFAAIVEHDLQLPNSESQGLHDSLHVGDRVAIKFFKETILEREEPTAAVARRLREIRIGTTIRHTNLVHIYDTASLRSEGILPYLVMEFLDGSSLGAIIGSQGRLSPEETVRIALAVAHGLRELHQAGVLHRDVKPENIQLTTDGRPVLLDLGVCRPVVDPTITRSDAFLGTLRYAAPEWLFVEECTAASDVYSLGGVFHSLVTGRPLFAEIHLYSQLIVAVRELSPALLGSTSPPEVAFLKELAERMLSKIPAKRPSLDEVIGIIEKRMPTVSISEQERWKASRRALGIIGDGRPPEIHLWRAMSEVDSFITLADVTRNAVSNLTRFVREFRDNRRRPQSSVSAMILTTPGCGSNFLVRRIAVKLRMRFLAFNLTQLINRGEIADVFDTIENAQSKELSPVLIFVDEFTCTLEGKHVYDLFQAAVGSGAYTRSGWDHVRLFKPAVWLFADTKRDESQMEMLSPLLTHGFFDLAIPLNRGGKDSILLRLESVYIGVSILRKYFPDVKYVSVGVLKAFSAVNQASRGRQLSALVKRLRDVRLDRVMEHNLVYADEEIHTKNAVPEITCDYSNDVLIRIFD